MPDKSPSQNKGPLGLEGDQYWNQPLLQKPADDFGFELVSNDIEGIFIDAPLKVYLDKRDKVPVACLRSGPTPKLRKHNFKTTAQLAIAHLETGRIQVVKPDIYIPDKNARPPSPGWTTAGTVVDLAELVDLGPKLGRYAAIILCGPESSNQRILTLYPSEKAEGTLELEKRIHDLRTQGGSPSPILIGKTLDLRHEGPPTGDDAWSLSSFKDAAGDRIRLEFRLEVPPRFLFAADRPQVDEDGKRLHANLPVTFVGFDENRDLILLKNIGLPVANPATLDAGKTVVEGKASLSLGKLLGDRAPKKSLSLWALALDRQAHVEIPIAAR